MAPYRRRKAKKSVIPLRYTRASRRVGKPIMTDNKNSLPTKLANRIFPGDCADLLAQLPDECVDLVVSSPPYNVGKEYESVVALEEYLAQQTKVLQHCVRVLKRTGSIFWQVGTYVDPIRHVPLDIKFFPILEGMGLYPRNRIVWIRPHGLHASRKFSGRHETILWFVKDKDHKFFLDTIRVPQKYPDKKHWKGDKHGELSCDPLGKNPGDVWAFRNVRHNHEEQTIHPAQFPEDLIERVMMATTEPGDAVLDPYMGVGTVAVVAKRFGRNFVGAELDEKYLKVAEQRLAGEPDENGCFPTLKSLREFASKNGIADVSQFRFTRQVGKLATTKEKARITPEQTHLDLFIKQTEGEADHPAYRRFKKSV
jgi:adenine-specific DNA-methyltransferase